MANERITVQIGADTSGLTGGLNKAETKIQGFARGLERAAQGPRAVLYGLMNNNPMIALAGGIGLLTAAIGGAVMKFAGFLDSMQKQADAVGVTVEAYQRLSHAAAKTGVPIENVLNAMTRFNSKLEEARSGNLSTIKSFTSLGLSISKLSNMSPDKAFNAMLTRLREIKAEGRDVQGFIEEFFGKREVQRINKLIAGNFESEQGNAKIVDEEIIKQSTELVNAFTLLKNAITVALGKFLKWIDAMGALQDLINRLTHGDKPGEFDVEANGIAKTRQRTEYDRASELNKYNRELSQVEEEAKKKYSRDNVRKELEAGEKLLAALNTEYKPKEITDKDVELARTKAIERDVAVAKNRIAQNIDDPYVRKAFLEADLGTDSSKQEQWFRDNVQDKHVYKTEQQQKQEEAQKKRDEEADRQQTIKDNEHTLYEALNKRNEGKLTQEQLSKDAKSAELQKNMDAKFMIEAFAKFKQETGDTATSLEEFRYQMDHLSEMEDEEKAKYFKTLQDEINLKKQLYNEQMREKQKTLVGNLQRQSPAITLDEQMKVAGESMKKSFADVGMDSYFEQLYADELGKLDFVLKNYQKFKPFENSETIFTNDLARRGGFNSSVAFRTVDREAEILDFVKLIEKTNLQRNQILDRFSDRLGLGEL